MPVLNRHLHGDLDRHGTGITEEHRLQGFRRQRDQFIRELHGRRMRQATEHDVRHLAEL